MKQTNWLSAGHSGRARVPLFANDAAFFKICCRRAASINTPLAITA
jgi:hypothetical protein